MPIPSPSSVLLRTQSDERLVVLARAGHERAFEAIVERYRGALLRAARRYLPESRAEDALQQAYISAWSALQRGDDVRDLRAWLYRIVHNMALNQLRLSGYDYAELEESLRGTDAPQEEMERRAIVRQTLTGLAALPERQREALLRVAVEGRSQEEVARELGVSEGAVRQLVHRARLTLRAAATAITPLPLATWAAGAAGAGGAVSSQMTERVAELVGGAGASAFFAKAGAVAVLATGTAVVVPAIAPSGAEPPPRPKVERTATPSPRPERTPVATPRATGTAAPAAAPPRTRRSEDVRRADRKDRPKRPRVRKRDNSGSGSSTSGPSSNSGSGSSGSSDSSGSSRSGSTRNGSSGSGSSGSGSSGSSGSGSGSGEDNSGPGSGSSGSGSSGSMSVGNSGPGSTDSGSGSGSSGSDSGGSGSDSSGPGSSGSGSSGSGSGTSGSSGSGSGGHGGESSPTPTATPSA